jgi:eukaryotic-like serine/threonine-protein kinase
MVRLASIAGPGFTEGDPMDQATAEQRVGQTLCGKWKLERLLGVGGMAAVYASVHKIGRHDAIKILHLDVTKNADLRARFEQEAHVANRFKHPGAVEIRDVDITEDGCPLLVMELLEGQTLSDKARKAPLELPELLRYVDELLDVLAAAHAQGIIHRDIKLDNLFITTENKLKVLDFGIARVRDGAVSSAKTAFGATLGTAPYMPPEQVQGREIDGRADLFAVGATMFRLLARRRIHEAQTEPEMLAKMATQPAPPLSSVAPNVPQDVCLIVDRALRFRKEDRYPDAATMQADVRGVRAGLPPSHATARILAGDAPPISFAATSVSRQNATVASRAVPSVEIGRPTAPANSAPPTPVLGATARAVTGVGSVAGATGPKTLAAAPSSIRMAPTQPGAPVSAAFGPPSSAWEGSHPPVEAPPSMAGATDPLRGPSTRTGALAGGTLKSADVVPLPDGAPNSSRSPDSTGSPVAVVPPPPRRASRAGSLSLLVFGGAFVVLGALVGVVVWMATNGASSAGAGGPARVEEGEPRHPHPHPATAAQPPPHETAREPTPTAHDPPHEPPAQPQNPSPAPGPGPKPGHGHGHGKKD